MQLKHSASLQGRRLSEVGLHACPHHSLPPPLLSCVRAQGDFLSNTIMVQLRVGEDSATEPDGNYVPKTLTFLSKELG